MIQYKDHAVQRISDITAPYKNRWCNAEILMLLWKFGMEKKKKSCHI